MCCPVPQEWRCYCLITLGVPSSQRKPPCSQSHPFLGWSVSRLVVQGSKLSNCEEPWSMSPSSEISTGLTGASFGWHHISVSPSQFRFRPFHKWCTKGLSLINLLSGHLHLRVCLLETNLWQAALLVVTGGYVALGTRWECRYRDDRS